jgi:hypothetical protein
VKATTLVDVKYSNGRVTTIKVTQWAGSGDWTVEDEYAVDANQRLRSLARVFEDISLGITQDSTYRIQSGKVAKEKSASHASRTGEPAADLTEGDLPDLPIVTDVHSFDFWPFIARDDSREIRSKGRVCSSVSSR